MKNYLFVLLLGCSIIKASGQDSIYQVHYNYVSDLAPLSFSNSNEKSFYSLTGIGVVTSTPGCCAQLIVMKFDSLGLLSWQKRFYQPSNATWIDYSLELDSGKFLFVGNGKSVPIDTFYILLFYNR